MFVPALISLALAPVPVKVTTLKILEGVRPVSLAAAPSGSIFVAALEDGTVRLFDAKAFRGIRNLAKHPQPAYAVAWSADGSLIATGDESARIFIEDARTGKLIRQYRTQTKGIQKLSFNRNHSVLISTAKDDTVHIYNLDSPKPKELRAVLGKGVNLYGACFNPQVDSLFAVGTLSAGGRIYECATGSTRGFLTQAGQDGIFDASYNPAGTRLVTAGRDGTAMIWDAKKMSKINSLKGHADWVVNAIFSPSGGLVVTSSSDRTVKVWNPYTFQKVADLAGESSVGSPLCFTGDGASLITVNDAGFAQINSVFPNQSGTPAKAVKTKKARRQRRRS